MDKQKVLSKLIWDLQTFLSVLDSENLSYIAQAQKKSISELLSSLQSHDNPGEDTEYMIMSCPSSSPGNEPADASGTDGGVSSGPRQEVDVWRRSLLQLAPPTPGRPGSDDDEDTYEEAEPYVPDTSHTEGAESESSHYESYGEDEDEDEDVKDRAHYISASQPCLRPPPESRLCGHLWRRRWLGQWSKQLFIVRGNALLCYKLAQDLLPQLEVNLRGCQLVYKAKLQQKIQHQLKLVPLGSDSLVLGYSSQQQAEEWRRVIEEVSCGGEETRSVDLRSCRSSSVQFDLEEEKPVHPKDKDVLNVLMNCQWQSLRCQVEAGLLNMFGEEQGGGAQYTVQLSGCSVRDGPHTANTFRITLSTPEDQVAVLEARTAQEKQRWMQLLQDGAAGHHSNQTALSGLQTRKFPTSNNYMDDPFHLSGSVREQPVYSNTPVLEHMLRTSQDSLRRSSISSRDSATYSNFSCRSRPEAERAVQKLELTGKKGVQLRAGSEVNLATAGKQNKRTSFRQSLAVCTERAQAGFLNPLLRRTNSAKMSLRRAPSTFFIEHGKVFQRKKEWESKAAA